MFTFPIGFMGPSVSIPEGLIIFYNGVTSPTNWDLYTLADGKYIVGADPGVTDYEINDSKAPTAISSMAVPSAGSHAAASGSFFGWVGINSVGGGYSNVSTSAGDHTHTSISMAGYEPEYNSLRLIKSSSDSNELPAGCVFLSALGTDLSANYTSINTDDKALKVNNTISSGGGETPTLSSSDGSHQHYAGTHSSLGGAAQSIYQSYISAVVHQHTVSVTVTPNMKRKILAAWTKASSFAADTGMIALWDQASPPSGWAICNGANGTVDLQQYFIELSDYTSTNTTGLGDNTISATGSLLSTSWSHTHKPSGYTTSSYKSNYYHDNGTATHSHTLTPISGDAYNPGHYALHFVQKL